MKGAGNGHHLVMLVADKNMEQALRGILEQPMKLGIDPIDFIVYVHPHRDPGCLKEAHDFLRPYHSDYDRALVVFDLEGSGQEHKGNEALEREVREHLSASGWDEWAEAVCIMPELENWVWSNSPEVANVLGWSGDGLGGLHSWLGSQGFSNPGDLKPLRPKEAMEAALRKMGEPRSSSLYRQLAERVSFQRCSDASFRRLIGILQSWFPPMIRA